MKEEKTIASPLLRFASSLFDLLFYVFLFILYLSVLDKATKVTTFLDILLNGLILLLFMPIIFSFINSFLISRFGGTLGKLIYGLKIVREEDNARLSFWRAFFREQIGRSVSNTLFGLGFIWILIDEKKRGWHDLISDTLVLIRNKFLWILGTALTIALMVVNVTLLWKAFRSFSANKNLYYGIFEDISKEYQSIKHKDNTLSNLPSINDAKYPVN